MEGFSAPTIRSFFFVFTHFVDSLSVLSQPALLTSLAIFATVGILESA